MNVVKSAFSFPSAVGDCDIAAVAWLPESQAPRAVIQVIHGMMEHIDRYDDFAARFVEKGYAVYGHSHLGHGHSVNEHYPLGYFGRKNKTGRVFREDAFTLTRIIRERHPGVPIVLFGYSMGSFVCRTCIGERGADYAAAIVCATGGENPDLRAGIAGTRLLAAMNGKAPGTRMNKLIFGKYGARTERRTNADWLSPDPEYVDATFADPLCGFTFSNQGFHDLLTLNQYMISDAIYQDTPQDMPILLISGADDPVGNYGEFVRGSYERYRETGHEAVELKLYPGKRHEIHLDPGAGTVLDDVLTFLDRRLREK